MLHRSARTTVVLPVRCPSTKHTASTRVHALTRCNYSRPFPPQRTVVLYNACLLLGCERQWKRWWNPLHLFSSEDLEPSGCSRLRFTVLVSELSPLILNFSAFWPSNQSCVGKTQIFFSFFCASAHLKMQTRCWDEKIFVSFHLLLLAAFTVDVWKQDELLLAHLENFKSPSGKDGTKPTLSRLLWRMSIFFCCHETVGHVYIHVLLVWL